MMQEDEGQLDGNELDQYLTPSTQQTHYLYSTSTPTHPLWLVHKSTSEDAPSDLPEANNNHTIKQKTMTSNTPLDYHYNTDESLSNPLLKYHDLQPPSTLIKTEREVYQQTSSPTISSSSSSPSMTYHQNLPMLPTPTYYNAGTTSNTMTASAHGQYFQSLPRYQYLFGNSGEPTWPSYT